MHGIIIVSFLVTFFIGGISSFVILAFFGEHLFSLFSGLLLLPLLLLLSLLLLLGHLFLHFFVVDFVIDQVVQRDHRLYQRTHVKHIHVVIGFHGERFYHLIDVQIWQQIENVLEILNDQVVVPVLAVQDTLHVKPHLLQFALQSFQTIDLVNDKFGELPLRCIFDVSEQMLHTHLFCLGCAHSAWHVDELPLNDSLRGCLFPREVGFGWQSNLSLVLNSDDNKDRVGVVSSQDFVDLDI